MLNDKVSDILSCECKLIKGIPLIVGVSGGADSLCLLHVLLRSGYQAIVAHYNHGIRPEAGDEAEIVRNYGALFDIPVFIGAGSVPDYSKKYNLSCEEAARIMRYRFLFEKADSISAQAVVVGHNADDQVETVLMNLLRGTGSAGLSGMLNYSLPNAWSESIPLVRPLLGIWRSEIAEYCRQNELVPVMDRSNLDTRYLRNQIRHDLIPKMESIISGFKERLWQTADLIQAEQDVMEDITRQVWNSLIKDRGGGYLAFDFKMLGCQPLAIQRRLFRKAAHILAIDPSNIDYRYSQQLVEFCANPSKSGQIEPVFGIKAFIEEDYIYLTRIDVDPPKNRWPQLADNTEISIPGEIRLGSEWKLIVVKVSDVQAALEAASANEDPYIAWLDSHKEKHYLHLRGRRPGDRFMPLGMDGASMKLSDYMINLKIPQRARTDWPLLCIDDEIAWVVGYQTAHPFRIRPYSREVLKCMLVTQ